MRGSCLRNLHLTHLTVDTTACCLQAGLDSLGAVDLRNSLSAAFSTDALPATLAFDYPTVAALAQLLLSLQPQPVAPQVRTVHAGKWVEHACCH